MRVWCVYHQCSTNSGSCKLLLQALFHAWTSAQMTPTWWQRAPTPLWRQSMMWLLDHPPWSCQAIREVLRRSVLYLQSLLLLMSYLQSPLVRHKRLVIFVTSKQTIIAKRVCVVCLGLHILVRLSARLLLSFCAATARYGPNDLSQAIVPVHPSPHTRQRTKNQKSQLALLLYAVCSFVKTHTVQCSEYDGCNGALHTMFW